MVDSLNDHKTYESEGKPVDVVYIAGIWFMQMRFYEVRAATGPHRTASFGSRF